MEVLLEPLSQATQLAFQKLKPRDSDRLFIDVEEVGSLATTKFRLQLKCVDPKTEEESSWPGVSGDAIRFCNRIPESHYMGRADYNKNNQWRAGATDFTALLIHKCWPANQIKFASEEAQTLYQYLLMRFHVQHQRAAMQAAFKLSNVLPERPNDWIVHKERPLSPHQETAVQFCLEQEACALFMDKGTGKTATAIQRFCMEAIRYNRETQKMYRVLIVCPQQVCMNWSIEIDRFAITSGKRVVIRGTALDRLKAITHAMATEEDCDFSAMIVPYDSFVASAQFFQAIEFDLCILDESHHIKSPRTERWKALREFRDKCKRKMILTASPIGNNPMDLWTQLEFLGSGLSGFQTFEAFRKFHGEWEDVGGQHTGVSKLVAMKNVPLLQERLSRLAFTITKKDANLQLPDKVYDIHEIEMTPRQRKVYEKVASELAVEIEDKLSGETDEMTIRHVLTALLRLVQVTSGFITIDAKYNDDGDVSQPKNVKQIDGIYDNPKINAVIELLKDPERDPLGKTIIWAIYREDIRAISQRLQEEKIEHGLYYGAVSIKDRDAVVDRFNKDPNCRVIICNPQSAGEGLNLLGYDYTKEEESTTYCDHEIFFSCNWSAILRGQAEDRAHRRGTRMPVRITDLTVPGTIDEEIRSRVQAKIEMANSITDVKSILSRVLNIK